MQPEADNFNNIIHKGDQKDPGPDQTLHFSAIGREIWLIEGSAQQFKSREEAIEAHEATKAGDITNSALAYWVAKDYIAWDVSLDPNTDVSLYYDPEDKFPSPRTGSKVAKSSHYSLLESPYLLKVRSNFHILKGCRSSKSPINTWICSRMCCEDR